MIADIKRGVVLSWDPGVTTFQKRDIRIAKVAYCVFMGFGVSTFAVGAYSYTSISVALPCAALALISLVALAHLSWFLIEGVPICMMLMLSKNDWGNSLPSPADQMEGDLEGQQAVESIEQIGNLVKKMLDRYQSRPDRIANIIRQECQVIAEKCLGYAVSREHAPQEGTLDAACKIFDDLGINLCHGTATVRLADGEVTLPKFYLITRPFYEVCGITTSHTFITLIQQIPVDLSWVTVKDLQRAINKFTPNPGVLVVKQSTASDGIERINRILDLLGCSPTLFYDEIDEKLGCVFNFITQLGVEERDGLKHVFVRLKNVSGRKLTLRLPPWVADKDLEPLEGIDYLYGADLSGNRAVKGEGLRYLQRSPIRRWNLSGCQNFGNQGLEYIKGDVYSLDLEGTLVDDEGLKQLEARGINKINLKGTGVTVDGILGMFEKNTRKDLSVYIPQFEQIGNDVKAMLSVSLGNDDAKRLKCQAIAEKCWAFAITRDNADQIIALAEICRVFDELGLTSYHRTAIVRDAEAKARSRR